MDFSARNNFFSRFFDDQNFDKSVNRARNAQIWVNFGQNGSFLNFPQKSETVIFFRLQRVGFVQKIRRFQCAVFEKNAKNLCFWAFWAKKGQIGPKRGHFRIFGQKVKTSRSYPFFFIFQNKKSENSNARFRRKSGGRRETERRETRETRVNLKVRIRPVGVGPKRDKKTKNHTYLNTFRKGRNNMIRKT